MPIGAQKKVCCLSRQQKPKGKQFITPDFTRGANVSSNIATLMFWSLFTVNLLMACTSDQVQNFSEVNCSTQFIDNVLVVAEVPISNATKSALKQFQEAHLIQTIDGRAEDSGKAKKSKKSSKKPESKSKPKKRVKSANKDGTDESYDGEMFPLHHYTKDIVQNGKFDNSFEEWLFAPIIASNPTLSEKMKKNQPAEKAKPGKKKNLSVLISDDEELEHKEKKVPKLELDSKSKTEKKVKPKRKHSKSQDSFDAFLPKEVSPEPSGNRLGAGERGRQQLASNRFDSEGDGSASVSARGTSRGYMGRPETNYFSGMDEAESMRSNRALVAGSTPPPRVTTETETVRVAAIAPVPSAKTTAETKPTEAAPKVVPEPAKAVAAPAEAKPVVVSPPAAVKTEQSEAVEKPEKKPVVEAEPPKPKTPKGSIPGSKVCALMIVWVD